jgi:hypothetical protein
MFDEAKWNGPTAYTDFGNTGRSEVPAELQAPQDTIYIQNPSHPMAANLSGAVQVYNTPYSVNFAIPGPEAQVIATAIGGDTPQYPTLLVYEAGSQLWDGTVTPGRRIIFFLGQGDPVPDFANLTADGVKLFDAAVAYAIPEPSTLALLGLGSLAIFLRKRKR